MYPRNTANIEQQLGANQDSVEQLEVAELRRQVAEAKARKEARKKSFIVEKLRNYEDENRSDSLNMLRAFRLQDKEYLTHATTFIRKKR